MSREEKISLDKNKKKYFQKVLLFLTKSYNIMEAGGKISDFQSLPYFLCMEKIFFTRRNLW